MEAIKELTGGLGSTAALETSGNPECRSQILKAMRTFGRCCYVGMGPPSTINFRDDVIFKVATIIGSWTFNKSELIEICRFMVEEKVPLDDLVTHRFALDDAVEAFRVFDGATTGKCVFVLD